MSKYEKSKLVVVKSSRGSEYNIPEELKEMNISQIIRKLASEGWKRSQIAKVTGIRYQHVRNVLTESTRSKK